MLNRPSTRRIAMQATAAALFAWTGAATGAPKVFILGDSRTCCGSEGYAKYVQTYVGNVATIQAISAETMASVGSKVGSLSGAAMVHFMGGLDDLTCLDGLPDSQRKARYDGYIKSTGSTIDKMKQDLKGTVIVHATMFKVSGPNGCSQYGFKDKRGDNNDFCDGTMCRRLDSDVRWFNDGSAKVARDKGIVVHDLYTLTKGYNQPDQRHFDSKGQVEIAKIVAGFIKANLNATHTAPVVGNTPMPLTVSVTTNGVVVRNAAGVAARVTVSSLLGRTVSSTMVESGGICALSYGTGSGAVVVTCRSDAGSWSMPVSTGIRGRDR